MSVWSLIIDGQLPGSLNMAVDDVLLRRNDPQPVLRLYLWDRPTLSLGMSQPLERHVNLDFCRLKGIPVVRRITGGKAVLHSSELTYSLSGPLTCPPFSLDLLDSYKAIAEAFCLACRNMGIRAAMASRESRASGGSITSCFAMPSAYEIVVAGRKLIGSAQKRTRCRVLQHGSWLIDYRPEEWDAVMLRHSTASSERVTSMKMLMGDLFSLDLLQNELIRGFEDYFGITFKRAGLSEAEEELARNLAANVYRNNAELLDSQTQQLVN